MTTILAWFVVTLTTGAQLEPELMTASQCRNQAVALAVHQRAGASISVYVLDHDCICEQYVAAVECRPYRMGATS